MGTEAMDERAANGQGSAAELEEAVHRLAPGLLRYCLARTGDRSLAEELSQEALTALVDRWRRRGGVRSPEAFVFTVARRRVARRALRRRLTRPLETLLEGGREDLERDPAPGPADGAFLRDRMRRVSRALHRLTANDREALLLVAAAELPMAEGAEVLGISVSALKMRLSRARGRLEALLEDEAAGRAGRRVAEDAG